MMETSGLFSAVYFAFLFCSLLVILLFKTAANYSAEVLSSVPKCTKAGMCTMEKIPVLDMLVQEEVSVLLAISSVFGSQQYGLMRRLWKESRTKQGYILVG